MFSKSDFVFNKSVNLVVWASRHHKAHNKDTTVAVTERKTDKTNLYGILHWRQMPHIPLDVGGMVFEKLSI